MCVGASDKQLIMSYKGRGVIKQQQQSDYICSQVTVVFVSEFVCVCVCVWVCVWERKRERERERERESRASYRNGIPYYFTFYFL